MTSQASFDQSPKLPTILSAPFRFIPSNIHTHVIVTFLNRLLFKKIAEGDLDFLMDKRLCINVSDMNIKLNISLNSAKLSDKKLICINSSGENDIEIKANVYDFMQLVARQQDPDTLVFQRRLIMLGSTELGLEIKNFLDAIDLQSSVGFSRIEKVLKNCLPVYQKIFS